MRSLPSMAATLEREMMARREIAAKKYRQASQPKYLRKAVVRRRWRLRFSRVSDLWRWI